MDVSYNVQTAVSSEMNIPVRRSRLSGAA